MLLTSTYSNILHGDTSMTTYCIYKVTNKLNGKSYVGFTNNFKKRKTNHIAQSKNSNSIFHKALRKYTPDAFLWQVIYMSLDKEHCKLIMEDLFIQEYKTMIPFGYNTCKGGGGKRSVKNLDRILNNNPMKTIITNSGSFKIGHTPIITEERNNKIKQSKLGLNNPNYKNPNAANHLNNKKYKCLHCSILTSKGNISRWHNDKCRSLQNKQS